MYKQNVNDIKVAVIMLDGCILDLNRYRYNYYKHLCNDQNITITKEEFYDHLGNMYDMYKDLPLSNQHRLADLNKKIEDELYSYLKYKGIYPREGLFELLDYFHQKDIKIAVMSTHRTKRALEYLQLTRVYSHVHYIIGSDTRMKPLPSDEMFRAIANQFGVDYHQMLVVSPFLCLNKVAQSLETNVLYFKDLIEPREEELQSSFKVVSSFFDVLNCLIFDSIYDVNMYSSVLGMNDKMNKDELDKVNQHLKDVYHDDQQILNIVEDTYQYHLSQLNQETKKEVIEENIVNEEKIEENEHLEIDKSLFEVKEEIKNDEPSYENNHQILSLNEDETVELTSAWNKLMLNEHKDIVEEEKEEVSEENHISVLEVILYIISDMIYSLAVSFLILFGGVIVTILIKNYSFHVITNAFECYYSFIETIYSSIFNALHSLISSIPTYDAYISSVQFVSHDGIQLLNIFVFHAVIIFVVKLIILIVKKEEIFNEKDA